MCLQEQAHHNNPIVPNSNTTTALAQQSIVPTPQLLHNNPIVIYACKNMYVGLVVKIFGLIVNAPPLPEWSGVCFLFSHPQPQQSEFFHYVRTDLMNNKKPVFKIHRMCCNIAIANLRLSIIGRTQGIIGENLVGRFWSNP